MRALIFLDNELTALEFTKCTHRNNKNGNHFLALGGIYGFPSGIFFDLGAGEGAKRKVEDLVKSSFVAYIDLTGFTPLTCQEAGCCEL